MATETAQNLNETTATPAGSEAVLLILVTASFSGKNQPERLILCGKTWMTVRFATAPDHLTNSLTLARDSLSNTEVIPHYHPSRISP